MTWAQRIKTAEKKGKFTSKDKKDAANWFTCALGERFGIRELLHEEPVGEKAYGLGFKFSRVVINDEIEKAKKTFERIQELKSIKLQNWNYERRIARAK